MNREPRRCSHVSQRIEDFFVISLEVASNSDIRKSLASYVKVRVYQSVVSLLATSRVDRPCLQSYSTYLQVLEAFIGPSTEQMS